ncbi:MAG: 30S ribosomal protein S8 [bacterium]
MDPIADFLTSIRNANSKLKERVDVPYSKIKLGIAKILKDEGFISNYKSLYSDANKRGTIRIFLKYTPTKDTVIKGLRRFSKCGRRVYSPYSDIPRVRGAFGISILSTSQGLVTDTQAKEKKVGGEVLCQVW